MNWFNLVWGILLIALGIMQITFAVKDWPQQTYWRFLPSGKYTTTTDYENERYVVKDVYGNIVAEFKRSK